MLIQCTKKLLDQLKIKPEIAQEDELYSWHANLITLNHRKTIVLINDSNQYPIILYGVKAKEFKNIGEYIISAIKETMLAESIKEEIVLHYINASPEIRFTKTNGNSRVARLNNVCKNVKYYQESVNPDSINQAWLNREMSRRIFKDSNNEFIYPYEMLYKDLRAFNEGTIISCKAIQLKVKLRLENHNVWRRLVVPHKMTFENLHEILVIAFAWNDYHLHDFIIYKEQNPIINIVHDEEALDFEYDVKMRLEQGINLSEYFPKYKRAIYRYDFGDNWQHEIILEDFIFDYDKNYPVCIAGEGDAPPEDVGGDGGYDEFVNIISNPNHEDYERMKMWAESQFYHGFNIDRMNRQLKHI